MNNQESSSKTWIVGCLSAAAVIVAAIIGLGAPFAERLADVYFPSPTPNINSIAPTQVTIATAIPQPNIQPTSLIVPSPTPKSPTSSSELSPLCKGITPLVFHNGLPTNDPCNGIVSSGIVSGVWVIVEPRTNAGWQTGKCLFHYSSDNPEGIYEGSMWALFRSSASDNALPTCPTTK